MSDLEDVVSGGQRRVFQYLQKIKFLPTELSEVELFIFGLTFLSLLVILNSGLLSDLFSVIQWEADSNANKKGGLTIGIILLIVGAFLAVYAAFTRREFNGFAKKCIRFFFPAANAALAVAIGMHAMKDPSFANMILTIWQFAQAGTFIVFTGHDDIGDFYEMPRRQARQYEIALATAIIGIVLAFSTWQHWYWAVAFSTVLLTWRFAGAFIQMYHPLQKLFESSPILGKREIHK